jgi:phospholipase/carboxylesterase
MEISAPLLTARLWRGMSRRHFLWTSAGALAAWMLPGCSDSSPSGPTFQPPTRNRLTARPGAPTETPTVGLTPLGIGGERDGFLYVPESYSPETPAPLFIALHGAGGSGSSWVSYPERAEARGMILLTPDSRASTWDLLLGGLGPDVDFLDLALQHTFERCRIDPTRLALGGFSDGASYTFSVGLSNGDLFSHLVAYSPGFVAAFDPIVGQPPVYVSHGTNDPILPVSTTRDLIVPTLSDAGYDVTYEEFGGGHELPSAISESALDWFLDVA